MLHVSVTVLQDVRIALQQAVVLQVTVLQGCWGYAHYCCPEVPPCSLWYLVWALVAVQLGPLLYATRVH